MMMKIPIKTSFMTLQCNSNVTVMKFIENTRSISLLGMLEFKKSQDIIVGNDTKTQSLWIIVSECGILIILSLEVMDMFHLINVTTKIARNGMMQALVRKHFLSENLDAAIYILILQMKRVAMNPLAKSMQEKTAMIKATPAAAIATVIMAKARPMIKVAKATVIMAKVRPAMMAMKAMPEAAIATVIMAKATPTIKVAKATVMTAMIKVTTVTSFSYICY